MCRPKSARLSHCFRITLREEILPLYESWQSCGKPSTKFPHGGLVECLIIPFFSHLSLSRIQNFHIFLFVLGNSHFLNFPKTLSSYSILHFITFSMNLSIHIDLHDTLDKVFCALFSSSSSKTLITRQNFALVHHFVRAQVCPA